MSTKAALKSIRGLLDSDPAQAAEEAKELLQRESQNYNAHVFLGFALDKLGQFDAAEASYNRAVAIKSNDYSAWQGLVSSYQKQGDAKLDSYHAVVRKLCDLFLENDDIEKCRNVVDKYVNHVRKSGSRSQYKKALLLELPTSPYYSALEGFVPSPIHTYSRVIEIAEAEEKEFINREIGERRTRIGATVEKVVTEVKREAFQKSQLDELYRGFVNWINDDDLRHSYEEKILQRAHDYLLVLPTKEKPEKCEEVIRLAREMVIIKHPFDLAWKITLEWRDYNSLADLDVRLVREFIDNFPDEGLSKVLKGFLASEISPFPPEEEKTEEGENGDDDDKKGKKKKSKDKKKSTDAQDPDAEQPPPEISAQERLLLMAEGLELCSISILAHRIMGDLYLHMEEWETASNIAQKGREFTKQLIAQTSLNMQDTTDALNITLGNALIEHQTPRNHPEARALFEEILERKPILPSCLLGIGLILVEDHDFISAVDFLEKAMKRDPDNLKVRSELYWAKAHNGELEDALHGLEGTLEILMSQKTIKKELKAELLYRIGYCQWEIDPSSEARTDKEKAYASFLGSAQANPDYAPAYTSLGIFYADYQQDAKRARLCFHRAFELSAAEVEAAERLARDFAEQKEWESVEVIAQRIIDAGRAKPAPGSKRKGHSWPYSALGVVEMSRQQYAKSIVHFQSALRIAPRSYECWVGLGESYHHSGRYGAATRAFQQAELLEPDLTPEQAQQIWFARYMLANVKREVGEYDDAIERYEAVASLRPGEFGVLIGLVQTLTENAQKCLDAGLYGEAAKNAQKAIVKGVNVAEEHPNVFNLWKAIGDAFSVFSWIKGKAALMPLPEFKAFLDKQTDETAFDPLCDIDDIGLSVASLLNPPDVANSLSRNQALYAAILAYKRAVTVSYGEIHAQAVAWYNLGWAEYRAYVCEEQEASSGLTKARKYLKASMRCFKRSIELEAGNSEYWNSLGVVTTLLNPKVAQHSFVRSLHLNDRSAPVWTNLGTLYLLHNDYELAGEAFNRAQSADPDYPHPWLGLGLLSLLSGDAGEARGYFTHAFEIGTSAFTMSRRQFSVSVFDHVITQAANTSSHIQALIQPLLSLHQLHTLTPHDGPYEHLLALFAERVGDFSDASATLDLVCSDIEAQYELSESLEDLHRFAQAKSDAARAKLASHEYEAAVDSAETALALSSEEGAERVDPDGWKKLRLSAHVTAGLAHYFLKNMDQAISMFHDALKESDNAPEVVCLIAQVLWAKGGEEERDVAREQLLTCISNHPESVAAVTLLGVIALLDADDAAIEAVESDLQEMRTSNNVSIHDRLRVTRLLAAIASVGAGERATGRKEEAVKSIMLSPSQPQGWTELALGISEPYAAHMALETSLRNIPPKGSLTAADLSKAYALSGTREDATKAVMLAPWVTAGWKELAHALRA